MADNLSKYKEDHEKVKELLSANFKVKDVEEHPTATMNFLVKEHIRRFQGGNPKKNLGIKAQKKIHKLVLKRLRAMYGKWITIRIINEKRWGWDTNLGHVYKTENGRIYGTDIYEDIFITTHALDRYEERGNPHVWEHYDKFFKRRYHTNPTSLDHLLFLLRTAYQVGISNDIPYYRYLNVNGGILVIEILECVMVIKTFLKYGMRMPYISWYNCFEEAPLKEAGELIAPDSETESDLDKIRVIYPPDLCSYLLDKTFG